MSTLLLFDIDGTLLGTDGVGGRAFASAFDALYGRPDACRSLSFAGMTDRAIVRAALKAIGAPITDEAIEAVLEAYLTCLQREMAVCTAYRIFPGVYPLLQSLVGLPGVAVGLGTGNLSRGAEIKLSPGRLWHYFSFGGYGSDHEERPEVIRIGAARGAEVLGKPLEACRVVVVGDTVKDVAAAKANGFQCVGVATGPHDVETLLQSGASWAFADLTQEGVREVLLGDLLPDVGER